jgi:hypothetical protein
VILICAFMALRPGGPQREVEATRQALRQQGFKTDLTEFNFSTSPESRNRIAALADSGFVRPSTASDLLDLMAPVGTDAALVIWRQDELPSDSGEDFWTALRESLDQKRASLDAASQAALSGPIRFNLDASAGASMLLRHASGMRISAQNFGSRALLELRDHHNDAAWTNLLAATRLVTAWELEPAEVSHIVRCQCVELVFKATWQTLQAGVWDDERLANLQREWESVDFLKGLPETAAFTGASMVAVCRQERQQPAGGGVPIKEMLQYPRQAWPILKTAWERFRYRSHGTYEDEKALLLYYRDRELQLRQAAQSPAWLEVRRLPGITNFPPFLSKYPSRLQSMMNSRQLTMRFQNRGRGLPGLAAEAEARRRVLITAIAIERFRIRHGSYPKILTELSPDLLEKLAVDFMDGRPLGYRPTNDGHFVLYSVGLDCVDNGGRLIQSAIARAGGLDFPPRRLGWNYGGGNPGIGGRGDTDGTDLVWPRPASAAEVKAELQGEQHREELRETAREAEAEAEEKAAELERQATVQKLLAEAQARKNSPPASRAGMSEPVYRGKPLGQLLRNDKVPGTDHFTLGELLAPKQILTGDEPGKVTFELPLNHDAVTNLGELILMVDGRNDDSDSGVGEWQSCERAPNGDCLLIWNTTFHAPGQHVIQAQFILTQEENPRPITALGPITPYFSSNLCQLSWRFSRFGPGGATLYAKLAENNGLYTIEIQSPAGEHVRAFTGGTSNGVIKVHWDLTDDHGGKYTNDSFESVYEIKLPDSGRSQKIK